MGKSTTLCCRDQRTQLWRNIADYVSRDFSISQTAVDFGVSQRTVYRILTRRDRSGRIRRARKPGPRPGSVASLTSAVQVKLVCDFREDHPEKGHQYCCYWLRRRGQRPPSATTIWRIWRRHGLLSGRWPRQSRKQWQALQQAPGYLQLDTMYLPGDRFAFVAIDVETRWLLLRIVERRDSAQAAQFLEELLLAWPGQVRGLQTDHGCEFAGRFKQLARQTGLPHYLAWVRCPDLNGKVERVIRTIREESELGAATPDTPLADLIRQAADFEHFYNHQRLHSSLDWIPPIEYLEHLSTRSDKPLDL